jgi:hypothetical protein
LTIVEETAASTMTEKELLRKNSGQTVVSSSHTVRYHFASGIVCSTNCLYIKTRQDIRLRLKYTARMGTF